MNKAIGGYFSLEEFKANNALPSGVLLNSASNALCHIIKSLKIKKIHIPYYTCSIVSHALRRIGCDFSCYNLDENFMPEGLLPAHETVLYVNYFGVSGKRVDELVRGYPNLIVDCAQAYYSKPKGIASFSSPRKFFGVPDGGIAYGVSEGNYDVDDSTCRMGHLEERKKNGATPYGYKLFQDAEKSLLGAPIKKMSKETRFILQHIDFIGSLEKRIANFKYLHSKLKSSFPFAFSEDDVPMVYPYITEDLTLREHLIKNNIFVARYWPSIQEKNNFSDKIIPLPIDHRYDFQDMDRICEVINGK